MSSVHKYQIVTFKLDVNSEQPESKLFKIIEVLDKKYIKGSEDDYSDLPWVSTTKSSYELTCLVEVEW